MAKYILDFDEEDSRKIKQRFRELQEIAANPQYIHSMHFNSIEDYLVYVIHTHLISLRN